MKDSFKSTIYYILGVILLIVLFQILSMAINDNVVVPSIGMIVKSFFSLLGDSKTYIYIGYSLLDLFIAIVVATSIGILLGTITGLRPEIYKVFKPLMSFFRILPVIVLILMVMLYSNLDYVASIVSSLVLIPIIYEGTYQGIIKVDKDITNAYRLDTKFNFRVLTKIYLPLISSTLRTALITALGVGIKVVITAEYICGSNNSLGRAIINALAQAEYSLLYSYSIVLIILILGIEFLPKLTRLGYDKLKKLISK